MLFRSPSASSEELQAIVYAIPDEDVPTPAVYEPETPAEDSAALIERIEQFETGGDVEAETAHAAPETDNDDQAQLVADILAEMASDPDAPYQPAATLYQDFTVRCRIQRMLRAPLDLPAFRRRFAMALAGISDENDTRWDGALRMGQRVPDDLLAPF